MRSYYIVFFQVEIAQKHPDIYAVPKKSQKLDHSRPQPIG